MAKKKVKKEKEVTVRSGTERVDGSQLLLNLAARVDKLEKRLSRFIEAINKSKSTWDI